MNFPGTYHSKLPALGTTIFTVMSALAAQHKAINLSQGFPDFEAVPELYEHVLKAMKNGHNQYAPMAGNLLLRERLAEKMEKSYSVKLHPEREITITAGGTQAIFTAITAMVKEGDEVLLFSPAYDCYAPAVELAGGKPVYYTLEPPTYGINWEVVKKLISLRTRMIVINSPHNPTGSVLTADDMQQLERIVSKTNILLLSDEVYEHMVYDGLRHESVLRYPALAERSFTCFSFGKTYHVTGWKLGYVAAPENLMQEFRKVHQYNVFAANAPLQQAFAEMLQVPDHYKQLSSFYQKKRNHFRTALAASRFELLPCKGSYFQLVSYKNITAEKDTEFVKRLVTEHGVAAIPVSVFYPNHLDEKIIRFCFAKKEDTLDRAAERLLKV